MTHVEVDRLALGAGELVHDGAAHHVTGGELGELVTLGHEALAILVDEVRALAAHRFADELPRRACDVQRRRMELDELQIADACARAIRHRDAVTRRCLGVRRLAIHLPRAAAGEDRCRAHTICRPKVG